MDYQHLLEWDVEQWNQWRIENPTRIPTLSGKDLSKCYLFEINLSGADLKGADLSRSCLIGADLRGTDLSGADLSGAYLSEANLSSANLRQAKLLGANLSSANLRNAELFQAQMAEADLEGANLTGTCLAPTPERHRPQAEPIAIRYPVAIDIDPLELVSQMPQGSRQRQKAEPVAIPFPLAMETDPLELVSQMPQGSRQQHNVLQTHRFQGNGSQTNRPKSNRPKSKVSYPQRPRAVVLAEAPIFTNPTHPHPAPLAKGKTISATWNPALLEQCQRKLSEYYIGPMVGVILDDIIELHRPKTFSQFIALVADQIPEPSEASRFRQSVQQSGTFELPYCPNTTALTDVFIEKCRQYLIDDIGPMARVIVDEIMAIHHPTTPNQLVKLIADKLPRSQAERFRYQALS
ncbi:MAG: pentapeptide repeat-containing protein [Cyanobacteria bacterium P01_A01_bin.123]